MKVEYRQDHTPELMSRARTRFSGEISRLRALGFSEFCCYTELLPRYSAITHFPIFILAKLNREIVRMESPLRLAMSQPILAHRERGAYALVFGMGVKFYTLFTDDTCLITANFPSQPIQDMFLKIYKSAEPRSIEDCWRAHAAEAEAFQQAGKRIEEGIRFENYISISRREDATAKAAFDIFPPE
jgi:hypothetical protein